MDTGVFALIGVFTFAAVCALWNWRRRRSIQARVAALGFEPCDERAPALERAWIELVRACGGGRGQEIRVSGCRRRSAGWGMLHRFTVGVRTPQPECDSPSPGARYDAYLIDLRDPEKHVKRPATLFVLPPGNALMRTLVQKTIEIDPPGQRLEIGDHPWKRSILAAYGEAEGKLDDHLSTSLQEKLARAADHGFFELHLGGGAAGFAVLPGHKDVDSEWRYLSEWV
jgi:hypothetical protein